jgi:hypothetical protein
MKGIDTNAIRKNRRFALLVGSSAIVILLLVMAGANRTYPNRKYGVLISTLIVLALAIYFIGRTRQRNLK